MEYTPSISTDHTSSSSSCSSFSFSSSQIYSFIYTYIHTYTHTLIRPFQNTSQTPTTYHHHYLTTNQIPASSKTPFPPFSPFFSSLPSLSLTHSRPQERKPNHLSPPHNSIQIRSNSRINSRLQCPFNPFFDGKLFVWRRGEDVVLVFVLLLLLLLV